MRILICGAGAMGCLFGSYLALAGEEVWLLSHWTEHIQRVRRDGLRVHPLDGPPFVLSLPILSYEDPLPRAIDVAFISVKSHQTPEAATKAARAIGSDGVAITMQNGLGNQEALAAMVGADRALLGVTSHGATLLDPGEVRHAGSGPTTIATDPDPEAANRIAAMLTRAGFASTTAGNIEQVLWNKLLVNAGINALTAILGVRNGALAEHEDCVSLLVAAVNEAATVATARGLSIPPDPAATALRVARATSGNVSSMLADILRQVPTEVDVINGAIVREGAALGLPTPVNETLTRLVKSLESLYGTSRPR
jgi:2-dehydropantoate 2-reductase